MTRSDEAAGGPPSGSDGDAAADLPGDVTPVPKGLQVACGVIALQALALVGVAGWVLVDTALGHTSHVLRGLLGGVFALVGAGALLAGARGMLRLTPAARTPIVVLQLLALPVSYSMVQGDAGAYGVPIAASALVVLYLLFTPPVRLVLARDIED